MTTPIRGSDGKFLARREARHIAAQITTLPIDEPRTPDFLTRPRHWHEGCRECYGTEEGKPGTVRESVVAWFARVFRP